MSVEKCDSTFCQNGRLADAGDDGVCELLKDLRRQVTMGTWTKSQAQFFINTFERRAGEGGCTNLEDIENEEDELLATAVEENIGDINQSDIN